MADVKWIKITTNMFDNRKIRHLRRLPDGNNIVLIWVMLLTMAGRCNANGMIFLTENIPYTPKMLADELDFEENTVRLALDALAQLNMIVTDQGFFTVAGWEEYQNVEGMEKIREQNRLRQRKWYDKQKALPEPNVIPNVSITHPNAADIEEEKEERTRLYISIVEYLNEKTSSNYKPTTAKTQRLIRARLDEGFTLEDFKKVIDNQCAAWIGGEFEKYLRPETLFGTKFEGYLNTKKERKKADGQAAGDFSKARYGNYV